MSLYLVIPGGLFLSSIFFCFLFWRSSPVWPKTIHQFWIELLFQYYGFVAFLEDKLHQGANHVELFEQNNRIAIVTGGNRGIGVHVVDKLLKCGLTVIVGVRNVERAKEEIPKVVDVTKFEGRLYIESLDMSDFSSVRRFAKAIAVKFTKIDILIHNAGIMACPYKLSVDGFESQMATNYLGPFLLTHLLLPEIAAAGTEEIKSRIVFVSSCLHFAGVISTREFNLSTKYYPVEAYMNSKLCQVVIAKELQRTFDRNDEKIQVFSVHPGLVDTDIIQYLANKRLFWRQSMAKTPDEGSRSIIYAAISKDLNYTGGDYISNCKPVKAKTISDDLHLAQKLLETTCLTLKIEKFGE